MEMQAAAQQSFGEQRVAEPLTQPLPSRVQQQEDHNQHLLLQQLSKHKLFTGAARPFSLFRPQGRPRVYSFSGVVSSSTTMSKELNPGTAGEVRCCKTNSPVANSVSLAFKDIRAAVTAPFSYTSAAAATALPSPSASAAATARAPLPVADGLAAVAAAASAAAQWRRSDTGGGPGAIQAGAYSLAASLSPSAARTEPAVQAAVTGDATGGGGGGSPAAVVLECTSALGVPSRKPTAVFRRRDERATTAAPTGLPPLRTSYATLFRSQTTTAAGRTITPAATVVTRAKPATTTSVTATAATPSGTLAAAATVGVSRFISARAAPAPAAATPPTAAPPPRASAVNMAVTARARIRAATPTSAVGAGASASVPPIGVMSAATPGVRQAASRSDMKGVVSDALLFPQEFAVSPVRATRQGRPFLPEVAGGGDKRAPTPPRQAAPAAPAADSKMQESPAFVAARFFCSALAAAAPPTSAAARPSPAIAKSPAIVRSPVTAAQLPVATAGLSSPATTLPHIGGVRPAIAGSLSRGGESSSISVGLEPAAAGRTAVEAGPAAATGGTAAAACREISAGDLFSAAKVVQGIQEAESRREGDNEDNEALTSMRSDDRYNSTKSSKSKSSAAIYNEINRDTSAGYPVFNNRANRVTTRDSNATKNSCRSSRDNVGSMEDASRTVAPSSGSRADAFSQSWSVDNTHKSNASYSNNPTYTSRAKAGVRPTVIGVLESEHSNIDSGTSNAVNPTIRALSPPADASGVSTCGAATTCTRAGRAAPNGTISSVDEIASANHADPAAYYGSAQLVPADASAFISSSCLSPESTSTSLTLCPPLATTVVVPSLSSTPDLRPACVYSSAPICSPQATGDIASEKAATRAGAAATVEGTAAAGEGETSETGGAATRGMAAGGLATPRTRTAGGGEEAATPNAADVAESSTSAAAGGEAASKAGGATARGMSGAGHAAAGGGRPATGGTAVAGETFGGTRAGPEVEKRCTSASMLSNKIFEEMEGPLRGKPPLIVGSQSHTAQRFFPHLSPVERLPACSYSEDGTPILNPPAGKKNTGREIPLHVRIAMDFRQDQVHPAVLRLGLQMGSRKVEGTNARTVAMLTAFQRFIEDYCPPPYEAMEKHLKIMLDRQINFITHCRPHSLAMGATIRWLKKRVSSCAQLPLHETKAALCFYISTFISERIVAATCAVADFLQDLMVCSGDCLLIYGYSTAVVRGLCQARRQGKCFSVIVVDARPYLSGRRAAMELAEAGVETTYTLLNGVAYHMDSVTRVILGAAALLCNAAVVNRAGAAIVAMVARSYNKPVVVCCELYKTFDRILLDSAAFNELDDPYLVWPETPGEAAAASARRGGHSRSARKKLSLAQAAATATKATGACADRSAAEEGEEEKAHKGIEGENGKLASNTSSSGSAAAATRSMHPGASHRRCGAAAGDRGQAEGQEDDEGAAGETDEAAAGQQLPFRAVKSSSNSGRTNESRHPRKKTVVDSTHNGAGEREEERHLELSGFSQFRFKRPPRLGAAAAALLSSSLAECKSGPFGGRKKPSRSLADIAAALSATPENPQPNAAAASTRKEGEEASAVSADIIATQESQEKCQDPGPNFGSSMNGEGSMTACVAKTPAAAAAHDAKEGSPAGTGAPAASDGSREGAVPNAAATAPGRKRSAGCRGGGGGLPAPEICVMNLCYDVTRAEFIDYFITEDGVFPTSNMPVLVHNMAH